MQHDVSDFNLATFLFSSKGRISRQPMGIMMAIACCISAPIIILWPYIPTWFALKFTGIMITACPIIKRLHDREKSGWWYAYFALVLVFTAACAFFSYIRAHHLFFFSVESLDQSSVFLLNAMFLFSALAYIGAGAWFLVEIFCLRGTKGSNAYGPDPVEEY